jgi:single-stranded-DNA-specific exonuclease
MHIIERSAFPRQAWSLEKEGTHPLLAHLYANRGINKTDQLDEDLKRLLPPMHMKGIDQAIDLVISVTQAKGTICIVADYDCDGATACATLIRGLKLLGISKVSYLVPNRLQDGYGLTPNIAERVKQTGANLLITVDNGIASIAGVARAKALGLQVLITDHHLPGKTLPIADAIINPNQPECCFPSKTLAGVGVVFYLLLGLRKKLRDLGFFNITNQPRLDTLLPLVALGTIADLVPLDPNNRRLVAQGLKRIRAGTMPIGMTCLFEVAKRQIKNASTFDLAFGLGPRINAAGRLTDMTVGIGCLLTDDRVSATDFAKRLHSINQQRRHLEEEMRNQAFIQSKKLLSHPQDLPAGVSFFHEDFHEGIVGIVAARLKEKLHRPTFVFAQTQSGNLLKGSGRSIPGLHLKDVLDTISKRQPDLLQAFGGHAMAAGCSIKKEDFPSFQKIFAKVNKELLSPETLKRCIHTDGPLKPEFCRPDIAELLDLQVWGQGFEAPLFSQVFHIISQRLVGQDQHLALKLQYHDKIIDGICFYRQEAILNQSKLAYRLSHSEWQGETKVKFIVEAVEENKNS